MKVVFSKILTALLGRKEAFLAESPATDSETKTAELKSRIQSPNFKENHKNSVVDSTIVEVEKAASDKCRRILNYWLDSELFDVPECPVYNEKDLLSIPLDDFESKIIVELTQRVKQGKQKINDKSRLMIMFQSHRAGYIAKDSEKHPNEEPPKTYLAGQALIPTWNEKLQTLTWRRSEEKSDLIVNLAAIRTLYRRCTPPSASNMSLSEWVEARVEHIENTMSRWLTGEDVDVALTSEKLINNLHELNRLLGKEFWPHPKGKDFMIRQCQPIDSSYQQQSKSVSSWHLKKIKDERKYKPLIRKDGDITFRWRFCFYPEGLEKTQLGPFFVQDLETCIRQLNNMGTKGLSNPLKRYLLGAGKQIEIPQALNNGAFFHKHTISRILGRWPENPKFGLSLLQSMAVNVALNTKENPIVAVNGPPGTGKTTLLKDVIAEKFVQRCARLYSLCDNENWQDDSKVIESVMSHSMVVASSNNKAVENISRELPSKNKIFEFYRDKINHYSEIAPDSDWGLFCAVMGKSSNRFVFKQTLKTLKNHLKNCENVFQLNELNRELQKASCQDAGEIIEIFASRWKDEGHLKLLATDILDSHAAKKNHASFLVPFAEALIRIEDRTLTVESFVQSWKEFSEEQWDAVVEALSTFKKQWFGARKGKVYLQTKLKKARKDFFNIYQQVCQADLGKGCWQLSDQKYLTKPQHYNELNSDSAESAEQQLQKSMPLGSEPLNDKRTELFIAALKFNEALLNTVGKDIANDFDELEQLIDGRLESNEKLPQHQKLWSRLFMFFPVVSTSLSSVENQFRLMQKTGGFGLAIVDEAGQAVNYHVVGLLQRCKQAIFVGDPIQLEPVVAFPQQVDLSVAEDFMPVSREESESYWGDNYLVSNSSAQTIADKAGSYVSKIGERKVGIPLLVHRRCVEPMFSVANKIAYDNKMVSDSRPFKWKALQSGWINVVEESAEINKRGYYNEKEAKIALNIIEHLVQKEPQMLEGGVYIITPFTAMKNELVNHCKHLFKDKSNHSWLVKAFGQQITNSSSFSDAISESVGTVHTFQGKEASTVIFCCSASKIRKKTGGIGWVNSKPNLINVAVTRAKHHLFVLGNSEDWGGGNVSSELQLNGMNYYESYDVWLQENSKPYEGMSFNSIPRKALDSGVSFSF